MSGFYLRSCLDHFHMKENNQEQNNPIYFLTHGSCFDFLWLCWLWTDLILQSEAIQDVLSYLFCKFFRHEAVTSTHTFSLDFFHAWDWVSYSYFSSFLTKFRQLVHIHTVATCASPEKNKSKENTNREVLAGWRQERRWILHLLLSQGFVCKSERILKSRQGVLGKIKEAMLMDWTYFEPLPGPLPLFLPIPITKD